MHNSRHAKYTLSVMHHSKASIFLTVGFETALRCRGMSAMKPSDSSAQARMALWWWPGTRRMTAGCATLLMLRHLSMPSFGGSQHDGRLLGRLPQVAIKFIERLQVIIYSRCHDGTPA